MLQCMFDGAVCSHRFRVPFRCIFVSSDAQSRVVEWPLGPGQKYLKTSIWAWTSKSKSFTKLFNTNYAKTETETKVPKVPQQNWNILDFYSVSSSNFKTYWVSPLVSLINMPLYPKKMYPLQLKRGKRHIIKGSTENKPYAKIFEITPRLSSFNK